MCVWLSREEKVVGMDDGIVVENRESRRSRSRRDHEHERQDQKEGKNVKEEKRKIKKQGGQRRWSRWRWMEMDREDGRKMKRGKANRKEKRRDQT